MEGYGFESHQNPVGILSPCWLPPTAGTAIANDPVGRPDSHSQALIQSMGASFWGVELASIASAAVSGGGLMVTAGVH